MTEFHNYEFTRFGKTIGHNDINSSTGDIDISKLSEKEKSVFNRLNIDEDHNYKLSQSELSNLFALLGKVLIKML